jgi:protein SCO1
MRRWAPAQIFLILTLLLAACGRQVQENHRATTATDLPGARTFFVQGVVREVAADRRTAMVEHETIPGYMEAMTMPIEVKDPAELNALEPGDTIFFRLVVTSNDAWMDQVTRLAKAPTEPAPLQGPRQVRWVDPLQVGDPMPDCLLTNQFGQPFQLLDLQGKALALTFIFTRCPLPTFCPRMSDHFATAARVLQADPDAPRNWHLLTLSFDPEHDTPSVLDQYAERYEADPNHWTFATGALIEIDALTEQVGLTFGRTGAVFDHNLRTVVLNPRGIVRKIFIGNQWTPAELVTELTAAARDPYGPADNPAPSPSDPIP